eukprot:CAMPEP_0173085080 /NCGR_PEP_ID=MMETSP1102-20130122/21227_1 /TAXON_ID=49646 /ORGANISM="Geminigera sp., Strain Caron Lab Isolate" /LENGTH=47 /DNA_ID= /DNA_START= /DNA_END= /DNA_ORIENTATION=
MIDALDEFALVSAPSPPPPPGDESRGGAVESFLLNTRLTLDFSLRSL